MKFRTAQKLDPATGAWAPIEFEQLRIGDRFRLYEGAGVLHFEGIVDSDPEPCPPEGNWTLGASRPPPSSEPAPATMEA